MLKVEHIGIAVRELSASIPLFEKLLNTPCYKTEQVESEQVATAFFKTGDTKIELLESSSAEGVIARFIDKKGEVRKIHTGFSGPGTGKYYEEFTKEFEKLTEDMLAEK